MPRGTFFSDFQIGHRYESDPRTVSEADVMQFTDLSGDHNPLHVDEAFAKKTPFGQRVAHGMLVASISTGQGQDLGIFEGTTLALMGQTFAYKGPVFFGDSVRLALTVESMKPSSKGGRGVVVFRAEILKQDDSVVNEGTWTVLFRDKRPA